MKKSKILIPAIAVLLLSGTALATSTVAWFTGMTAAKVDISGIQVINPEVNLGYTLSNANDAVTIDALGKSLTYNRLRDASVNMSDTPTVYGSDTFTADGTAVESLKDVTANPEAGTLGDGTKFYYYAKWTITFTITVDSSMGTYGLYFDAANSTLTLPSAYTTAGGTVHKGFRMGFVNGSKYLTWAPETTDATVKSATSTSDVSGTEIAAANLTKDDTVPADDVDTGTHKLCLGTFPSDTKTISVDCYSWFEGCDSSIVNSANGLAMEFASSIVWKTARLTK
ncbi:MAG: hypothetical protein ACI31G_00080 [Bacilli bacterium]